MQRNRRDFLKLCGLAGLGVAVPLRFPLPTRAEGRNEPYPGPYYVVFNASGGWDTTYLMDPKGTGGINRLFKEGDILTHGAHKYAPTAKHIQGGLSNEDFYAEFGKELLAINGLDYSVNNHAPGTATWRPASWTAWLTRRSPPSSPPARARPARCRS